ncbi:glutamine--fructose-6-phosphate transaminase (isomerizing) [Elusimicrobiota bacterium]
MCGIIGYVGKREALPIIFEGLKRLEYRGYDSAGISVLSPKNKIELVREVGKLGCLEQKIFKKPMRGVMGIGHSRWATHGHPSSENAHPHLDCKGGVVLVHNGIIENYLELKSRLIDKGHCFTSETDTEVLPHLFEEELSRCKGSVLSDAAILAVVRKVTKKLHGAYAFVVMSKRWGNKIVGVRKECPLIFGEGEGEHFLASDIPALLAYTKKVMYLRDGEMMILSNKKCLLYNGKGKSIKHRMQEVPWDPLMAEKGGFKHFMHKEIHEGPRSFEDTLRGRVHSHDIDSLLEEAGLTRSSVKDIKRVQLLACGTASYAALVGEYLFENIAGVSSRACFGSEYRYSGSVLEPGTLAVAVSQSGETADTLAAMKILRSGKGVSSVGIVNQIGSTLTRLTGGTLYTRCGPEIGVASTKAFVAQLACLYLLALAIGKLRKHISDKEFNRLTAQLLGVPHKLHSLIKKQENHIIELAREFQDSKGFMYLGRRLLYPIAMEGALKLKEISYIHAEGYAAGEIKHGPIALIDREMPVFAFMPKSSSLYAKMRSNLEEVYARGARTIAVVTEGDHSLRRIAHATIETPAFKDEWFEPVVAVACAQLFAYHVANSRGLDVDQPRNLAKSVTVE